MEFPVLQDGHWSKERTYPPNPHPLLQLAMSQDEHFVIGTFMTGFQLWQVLDANKKDMCQCTTLKLPSGLLLSTTIIGSSRVIDCVLSGIRNISTKMNKSNACVLSAKHVYAIAGIRKELYIWQVSQCEGHAGFLKRKKLLAIFS